MSLVRYKTIFINDLQGEFPEFMHFASLLVDGESFVAGGAFRSIAMNITPKDIDVFFYNDVAYNKTLIRFENSHRYKKIYSTSRSTGFKHINSNTVVDLVCYQYGDPYTVIDRFDFTVCQSALFIKDGGYKLVRHPQFLSHIEMKTLCCELDEIRNPDQFFNRMVRYMNYGFVNMDLTTKTKLFQSIQSSDMNYPITRVDVNSRQY